jgi:two-component system, cell cycle sensor histidine kinase and response regulator CckA
VPDQAPHHLHQALQRDLSERCYTWLESISEGCVVLDPMFAVRYCNPAFASLFAVRAEQLLGEALPQMLPAFKASLFHQLCERALLHGRFHEGEVPIGERWYQTRVHRVAEGLFVLMAEARCRVNRDVAPGAADLRSTEADQARSQERVYQEQQRESLEVVVGGVAHDFNNLLVGLLNGAELLLRDLPEDSPLRETVEIICKAGARARDVARQMLVLVGKGRAARRPLDINLLVSENVPLLQTAFPGQAQVEAFLHEGLPFVHADAGQMQQVAMNLLVNAAEALRQTGGRVRVTTSLVPVGDPEVVGAGGERSRQYVSLEVADDGPGMTAEVQARIFEPYFTTKTSGHGLGLAAVRNIVRAHDGLIRLTSTPGKGTTFRIYLPVVQPSCSPARAPETGEAAPEVLIVDDEPFVRDVIGRMLRNAGFQTRAAAAGADAVAAVREHPAIGLVLLDLKMPGMDGWETLRQLGEIRPDLGAILTSGCADDLPPGDDPRVVGFLPKPYVFESLVRLVHKGFAQAARAPLK